jgi:hypothetical protein
MFVQRIPTAQALKEAGKRKWEKLLLWRAESAPRRLELFARATEFCGSEPMTNAKSQLALSLVSFALEKQLGIYRQRIEEPGALAILRLAQPRRSFGKPWLSNFSAATSPKCPVAPVSGYVF